MNKNKSLIRYRALVACMVASLSAGIASAGSFLSAEQTVYAGYSSNSTPVLTTEGPVSGFSTSVSVQALTPSLVSNLVQASQTVYTNFWSSTWLDFEATGFSEDSTVESLAGATISVTVEVGRIEQLEVWIDGIDSATGIVTASVAVENLATHAVTNIPLSALSSGITLLLAPGTHRVTVQHDEQSSSGLLDYKLWIAISLWRPYYALETECDVGGDSSTDPTVYWPQQGGWFSRVVGTNYIWDSSNLTFVANGYTNAQESYFGWSAAQPVSGDYDSDGDDDDAVYHPDTGNWFIRNSGRLPGPGYGYGSSTDAIDVIGWGWKDAFPVRGDFDGDGRADLCVYHPDSGGWYIRKTSTEQLQLELWGWKAAIPVPGDYDGDGTTDIAVYHPATGTWYIRNSFDNTMRVEGWGWAAAMPVQADYDGDGRTDLAVYHPANGGWYIRESSTGNLKFEAWGWPAAVPVPGDYDGNGQTDIAVFHPASGNWHINMGSGQTEVIAWGWSEAVPVNSVYLMNRRYFNFSRQ